MTFISPNSPTFSPVKILCYMVCKIWWFGRFWYYSCAGLHQFNISTSHCTILSNVTIVLWMCRLLYLKEHLLIVYFLQSLCVFAHVCICLCMYICMYVCMYVCMCVCLCACIICVCLCVFVHACVCVCEYMLVFSHMYTRVGQYHIAQNVGGGKRW